jgi:signal transduction histidine kinase
VKRTLEVRNNLQQLQTMLLSEETWVRTRLMAKVQGSTGYVDIPPVAGAFLGAAPREKILKDLENLLRENPTQLGRLRRVYGLVEQELLALEYALAESPTDQPSTGNTLPKRLDDFMTKSQLALNELHLQIQYMLDDEDRNLARGAEEAQRASRWTLTAIVGSAIFGLGGGILAMVLFTAGVVQRVQRSEQNARRLAQSVPMLSMPQGRDEIGRLGVALDETQGLLVQREEALKRARDEAEQANQAKSAFLANVSHELRTPLNAILGFTRLVLRKVEGQIPALQRENLQKVLVSAEHLLTLINGLLDLSKIEAGKMEIFVESFRLDEVIDVAVSTVEPTLKGRVQLIQEIGSDIPPLHTDREKLRQIILNLLSNAAKFTEEGSITISALSNHGSLKVVVADTGIGITHESLPSIFDEFRQADMSSTRKYGGTGLGLAIVKRFVDLLGGEIGVESTVGRGSTFTVTLPLELNVEPKG